MQVEQLTILEEVTMQIASETMQSIFCRRCHKEPRAEGQDLCLKCQYQELGEKMFIETLSYRGHSIKLDLTGRAHILSLAIGDYHPIFRNLLLAKQWIDSGPLNA